MCPGCPVEDDVCLDVLVSWLAGRLIHFFIWDSTMLFFPLKLGHDPTLTKLLFSRFSSPHSRNHDLKSLMQVAYGDSPVDGQDTDDADQLRLRLGGIRSRSERNLFAVNGQKLGSPWTFLSQEYQTTPRPVSLYSRRPSK